MGTTCQRKNRREMPHGGLSTHAGHCFCGQKLDGFFGGLERAVRRHRAVWFFLHTSEIRPRATFRFARCLPSFSYTDGSRSARWN